jgi:hypothetical protein
MDKVQKPINSENRRIVGRFVFNMAHVVSRKVGDLFFPEILFMIDIVLGIKS